MHDVVAMGDEALRFALPPGVDRRALLEALRASAVDDVVLAERLGVVTFRAGRTDEAAASVRQALRQAERARDVDTGARAHDVPVVYDGEDLDDVAHAAGLSRDGVVELHAGATYRVAMLGFLPGFAYLRGLDARLVLPRRSTPRPRVPAGSLAIAAEYTGIYPFASPGGWHLLGRVDGFAPFGEGGAALGLGDVIRFTPRKGATAAPRTTRLGDAPSTAARGAVEVARADGPSLVVDAGRRGHMHEGVPPGGPLDADGFARANEAAGNAPGAAALEIHGALAIVARSRIVVGDDRGTRWTLDVGDRFSVATEGRVRVRCLAVAGGVDVPPVLDGRGTLLVAGLGGLEGRALRRGDVLPAGDDFRRDRGAAIRGATPAHGAIDVVAGPDHDPAALDALARGTFRIARASDRTGTRLEAHHDSFLPHDPSGAARASTPMVLGAIQRTPAGLIVLGPDHPTTGGYPVVAVLAAASRSAFFRRPIGAEVTFRIVAR